MTTVRAFIYIIFTPVVDSAVEHGNTDLNKHNNFSLSVQILINSLSIATVHAIHEY